jgi:hypothetical protein
MSSVNMLEHDRTFSIRQAPATSGSQVVPVSRQAKGLTNRNTLNRYSPPVLLEMETAYFHHNSAVMMPDTAAGPDAGETSPSHFEDPTVMNSVKKSNADSYERFRNTVYDPNVDGDEEERVSGLGALAAAYRFLQLNSGYKLLIAGHCDTSGEVDYNFYLSKLRPENVLHLLLGQRSPWVDTCMERFKIEDYQSILKYVSRTRKWDCDPGAVDDVDGEQTQRGLRGFQQMYNSVFSASISVDGLIGRETWGAFFDVYIDDLAGMLGTTPDGLGSYRSALTFVDANNRYIACGEQVPIDQPQRDNFRSQENRRVELSFFKDPSLPDLSCHKAAGVFCQRNCSREECGVYAPGVANFVMIDPALLNNDPPPGPYQDQFTIADNNDDLTALADQPDELYASQMGASDVADGVPPEIAWDYLDPFQTTDPPIGIGETTPREDQPAVV